MDKYTMIHSYKGISLVNKGPSTNTCNNVEEPPKPLCQVKKVRTEDTFSMIPLIRHSGKGIILGTKSDQWLPSWGGGFLIKEYIQGTFGVMEIFYILTI